MPYCTHDARDAARVAVSNHGLMNRMKTACHTAPRRRARLCKSGVTPYGRYARSKGKAAIVCILLTPCLFLIIQNAWRQDKPTLAASPEPVCMACSSMSRVGSRGGQSTLNPGGGDGADVLGYRTHRPWSRSANGRLCL